MSSANIFEQFFVSCSCAVINVEVLFVSGCDLVRSSRDECRVFYRMFPDIQSAVLPFGAAEMPTATGGAAGDARVSARLQVKQGCFLQTGLAT